MSRLHGFLFTVIYILLLCYSCIFTTEYLVFIIIDQNKCEHLFRCFVYYLQVDGILVGELYGCRILRVDKMVIFWNQTHEV